MMPHSSVLKEENSLQLILAQRLMVERSVETADRIIQRLESLQTQYPSDELREKLRELCNWRARLRAQLGQSSV